MSITRQSSLIKEQQGEERASYGEGVSTINLKNFRQFYQAFPYIGKGYALRSELSWTESRCFNGIPSELYEGLS